MNKEIICDNCKKDLTKLPTGSIYYKFKKKSVIFKKKTFNIFGYFLAMDMYSKSGIVISRYCSECYNPDTEMLKIKRD